MESASMAGMSENADQVSETESPGIGSPFPGFESAAAESRDVDRNLTIGLATIRHGEIPRAIERLDAIVRGTEQATNKILDACAALEATSAEIGGALADQISDVVTTIYEACGFQDLAGQRIASVTKMLGLIEGKLSELTSEFGLLTDEYQDAAALIETDQGGPLDNLRLDGPQLPENAPDQNSVDQLFKQMS